ncbi:unnamed protein product, partial [Urochloa humidicola]
SCSTSPQITRSPLHSLRRRHQPYAGHAAALMPTRGDDTGPYSAASPSKKDARAHLAGSESHADAAPMAPELQPQLYHVDADQHGVEMAAPRSSIQR